MFESEEVMQNWLSNKLKSLDGLNDLIDGFNNISDTDNDEENTIIKGYRHCLKSLHVNEVVTDDKNISGKKGDVLRPDFLMYSPETQSFVILELKNISGPTREVGTELGAYSAELKSQMPFISDADIVHVIISNHWPTLLRHYIFNEIFWQKRSVLCLEPYENDCGNIRLKPILPSKLVEYDGSLKLCERHLGGFQLCLYDNNLYRGGSREQQNQYIEQMKTAISSIALKGNAQGGHGFAFLWKDTRPYSLAPHSITILNIAPFQTIERIFKNMNRGNIDLPEITEKFIKILGDHYPMGQSQSLTNLVDYSNKFLNNICSPRMEGFHHWGDLKSYMLESSELIEFHSWGVFSDYFVDRVAQEYDSGSHNLKLTDPIFGLQFIDELIDPDYEFIDLSNYFYEPEDEEADDHLD